MTNFWKKFNGTLLLIIIAIPAIILTACRCDDVKFPYYDFQSMAVSYDNASTNTDTIYMASNDSLMVRMTEEDISVLAQQSFIPFVNTAYATQPCPSDGHLGRKFPVVSINIYSDVDFDSNHPAGASLNDIVLVSAYNYQTYESEYIPLSSLTTQDELNYVFLFVIPPSTNTTSQQFTFDFTKSNNEIITAKTLHARW